MFAQEAPKSFKLHHAQLTRSLQLFSPGFFALLPSVSYLLCTSRCATALRCDLVCQQFLEAVNASWIFRVASSLDALAKSWSQSQAGRHTKLHVSQIRAETSIELPVLGTVMFVANQSSSPAVGHILSSRLQKRLVSHAPRHRQDDLGTGLKRLSGASKTRVEGWTGINLEMSRSFTQPIWELVGMLL